MLKKSSINNDISENFKSISSRHSVGSSPGYPDPDVRPLSSKRFKEAQKGKQAYGSKRSSITREDKKPSKPAPVVQHKRTNSALAKHQTASSQQKRIKPVNNPV
jgi:hypothetical protein